MRITPISSYTMGGHKMQTFLPPALNSTANRSPQLLRHRFVRGPGPEDLLSFEDVGVLSRPESSPAS